MTEDHSKEKFAADITKLIIMFMKHITAVKNLEGYYLANKSPIEKVKNISQEKKNKTRPTTLKRTHRCAARP